AARARYRNGKRRGTPVRMSWLAALRGNPGLCAVAGRRAQMQYDIVLSHAFTSRRLEAARRGAILEHMKLRTFLIVMLLLPAFALAGTYKWVDKNGNVH